MEGSGPSDELQEVEEELIHKKEGEQNVDRKLPVPIGPWPYAAFFPSCVWTDVSSACDSLRGSFFILHASRLTLCLPGAIDDNLENGGKPLTPTSAAREQKLAERPGMGWKVFTQAFTLTFLAEWGDRSQIATIALAAAKDPVGGACGCS
jgi:putative Ca2+/H+ antiporter (TMEM165/GDT1 family)